MKRIFILALFLSGCATSNPFSGILNPPSEPRKIANYVQTEKQVPLKVGVTADGKDVIAYQTERSYTAGSSETQPPVTFMQRIGRWIGGLSILGIVFVIGSLALFGGTPILWAVKKYYSMKNAFKKTVAAIEEIPKETFDKELASKLKENLDEPDKKLIKKLKTEI